MKRLLAALLWLIASCGVAAAQTAVCGFAEGSPAWVLLTSEPTDNYVLTYDAATNCAIWEEATGGSGSAIPWTDDNDVTIVAAAEAAVCGATMSCTEDDPDEIAIEVDTTELPIPNQTEGNVGGYVTRDIDQDFAATFNIDTGEGGLLTVDDRPLIQAPAITVRCDNYALDAGRRYCSPFTDVATATASVAQMRMAFPCTNLRTITVTFKHKDTGATAVWPSSNTLTIGMAVGATIPGDTRCTFAGDGSSTDTSCDDIDYANLWARNDDVAVWVNNSGNSTEQRDVIVQGYCGH